MITANASLPVTFALNTLTAVLEAPARCGPSEVRVSAATERLRMQVRRMGPHFRTALVTGERGVKKEAVARALHAAATGGGFFVPEANWLESVGERAGTDADRKLWEFLRKTQGGTIFFGEVQRFSAAAQAGAMRVLEAIEGMRGERARVIATVTGDAQRLVAEGVLRADLVERVGTIEMPVMPLRERLEDIADSVWGFLSETARECATDAAGISDHALRELERRQWPGNDRELDSVLRIAMLASGGECIEMRHLPAEVRGTAAGDVAEAPVLAWKSLQDVVDAHVQGVLRGCEGNKLRAAEVLGISRSTLYRMLEAAGGEVQMGRR